MSAVTSQGAMERKLGMPTLPSVPRFGFLLDLGGGGGGARHCFLAVVASSTLTCVAGLLRRYIGM